MMTHITVLKWMHPELEMDGKQIQMRIPMPSDSSHTLIPSAMKNLLHLACIASLVFVMGFMQSCVEDDLNVIDPTDEMLDARSSALSPKAALGKKIFFD